MISKKKFTQGLTVLLSSLFIVGAMNLSLDTALGAEEWNFETVDSGEYVGRFNSIAVDVNSHPRISYYDDTNGNLKYARWTGSLWDIDTVDSDGEVG